MKSVDILPATPMTLREFYDDKICHTQRAYIVFEDGEPIAVFGIYLEKSRMVLFSDIRPDIRDKLDEYKRVIVQCVRKTQQLIKNSAVPVSALADPEHEGSNTLLEHVGLTHIQGGVYKWL